MSRSTALYSESRNAPALALRICQSLLQGLTDAPLAGRVHTVFAHAVNIDTPQGLVTLLTRERSSLPGSVVLNVQGPFPLLGWERDLSLTITKTGMFDEAGECAVSFKRAEPIELFVYNRIKNGNLPKAEPIVSWLSKNAGEEGVAALVTGQGSNPYVSLLKPRLPVLFGAVHRADTQAITAAAARIAGCGMGLTPSSDDLLCGYMATLHALAAAKLCMSREELLPLTRTLSQAAAEKTNRISAAFLAQSGNGYVSDDLLQLLEALLTGAQDTTVQAAADKVGSFGSTSGADMLTGVALALIDHQEPT